MVSMVHPARAAAEASGVRARIEVERRSRRWLWRLARRRKLARWARGEATFRAHLSTVIGLSLGPAGQHTEEHVARQRELAAHNGKLVSVGYMIWG